MNDEEGIDKAALERHLGRHDVVLEGLVDAVRDLRDEMRNDREVFMAELKHVNRALSERQRTNWGVVAAAAAGIMAWLTFYNDLSISPIERDISYLSQVQNELQNDFAARAETRWTQADHWEFARNLDRRFELLEERLFENTKAMYERK